MTTQNVETRKQEQAEAGVAATGIEPETAIQRDCSVTKHPQSCFRGHFHNYRFPLSA
jgi:pyruvate formate-lyase activating enzyme-like uncharacterized protein